MTNLFTGVLHMSITASYIALAVMLVRIPLKKVPKIFSYILWLPVLIRLVFPFSFSTRLSFFNFLNPGVKTETLEYLLGNIGFIHNPTVDTGVKVIRSAVSQSFPQAAPMMSTGFLQSMMTMAGMVWIAGVVVLLVYSMISYMKLIRNIKTATLVRDNIYETDRMTTPFVCGLIRPKIYIPAGMHERELAYILEHEQTHIKRLDYLVKPFAYLVLVIHWFNPLVWVSFALMSKDMEMSCDESVLRKIGGDIKAKYSSLLLLLETKRSGLLLGSPLAFGESSARSRIKNILGYKKPASRIMMALLGITVVLVAAFATNPTNQYGRVPVPTANPSGDLAALLIAHKTPYVGNNSKVIALVDTIPLPKGIVRDTIELQTRNQPYGITINLKAGDVSGITTDGAVSGGVFYRSAILLFSVIDNVDIIVFKVFDNTGEHDGASYSFTYTRQMAERAIGRDVCSYAGSSDTMRDLIEKVKSVALSVYY